MKNQNYIVQNGAAWPNHKDISMVAEIKNLDHKLIMKLFGGANSSSDKSTGWEVTLEDGSEIELYGRDSYAGIELEQNDGMNGNWELAAEEGKEEAAMDFIRSIFPQLGRYDVTAKYHGAR